MDNKQKIFLSLSLDVEEEGLFSGSYICKNPSITNTKELFRLIPFLEQGIKPTLFCDYVVFNDKNSLNVLEKLQNKYPIEIAGHLHHWCTPPYSLDKNMNYQGPTSIKNVLSKNVPIQLLEAKLQELIKISSNFLSKPITSFRMGRWDLHQEHFSILAKNGILVDSSIRPIHDLCTKNRPGPDHFIAPHNPYWIETPYGKIFEIPLTSIPILPIFKTMFTTKKPSNYIYNLIRTTIHKWGAFILLPIYHPLWFMKLVTKAFLARGGKVLTLTWHSSEMLPGGTPHLPNEEAIIKLLNKISAYLDWLNKNWDILSLTTTEIKDNLTKTALIPYYHSYCDWTYCGKKQNEYQ